MPSTTSVSIAGPFFVCKVNNMSAFGCFSSKVGVLKWVPCQSFGSRAVTASTDIRTKRNCLCFFSYCLFWRKRRARGCGVMNRLHGDGHRGPDLGTQLLLNLVDSF